MSMFSLLKCQFKIEIKIVVIDSIIRFLEQGSQLLKLLNCLKEGAE